MVVPESAGEGGGGGRKIRCGEGVEEGTEEGIGAYSERNLLKDIGEGEFVIYKSVVYEFF